MLCLVLSSLGVVLVLSSTLSCSCHSLGRHACSIIQVVVLAPSSTSPCLQLSMLSCSYCHPRRLARAIVSAVVLVPLSMQSCSSHRLGHHTRTVVPCRSTRARVLDIVLALSFDTHARAVVFASSSMLSCSSLVLRLRRLGRC
ncbi:hypothetical protein BDQ12DRAFT_691546 [Crucibulum laeve]|uniref:Secreted protein n=1 Tax=Crucibulum laeve TaxID=68775 RepID=A0A5C3LK63_9AGAR|nr:hypothetical protein BDQ12DRAFT_691546 [Crucibulum laeve]